MYACSCRRRQAYDLAKKQGYVVLRGTGYRRERKGSPLQNIFRQFCDAKAMACTSVLTGQGSDAVDEVEIDFSPLRASREVMDSLSEKADAIAAELQAPRVERELESEEALEDDTAAVGIVVEVLGPFVRLWFPPPDRIPDGKRHLQEYLPLPVIFVYFYAHTGVSYPEQQALAQPKQGLNNFCVHSHARVQAASRKRLPFSSG